MKRTVSLILAFALLFSSILCILPSAAEQAPEGNLEVSSASLQFGSNVFLLIAVDYSELYADYASAKENVTVKLTNEQGDVIELSPDDSLTSTEDFPKNSIGFKCTSIGAKNMTDQLTIQAYDKGIASGASKIYSILEYAVEAKASSQREAFKYAIDCMLELGAEAQKAFGYTGDYPLYDEDGFIDYGMLIVYGGATKKIFGKVGSKLTPEANSAVGANPKLYTTDYKAVENNSVEVEGGVSKYFYVGDATRTLINLDMDNYVGDSTTVHTYYDGGIVNKTVSVYMKADGSVTLTKPSGNENSDYATLNTNASPTSAKPDGGFKTAENGALTITTAQVGPNVSLPAHKSIPNLSADKYTISISIKAPNGLTSMGNGKTGDALVGAGKTIKSYSNGMRFRNGYLWFYLWSVSSGKLYLGNTSTDIVLGTYSATEYTTFHIVVDRAGGRFIAYDGEGNYLGECSADVNTGYYNSSYATLYEDNYDSDPSKFLSHGSTYLNWSMANTYQGASLNRLTFTNGNIFE